MDLDIESQILGINTALSALSAVIARIDPEQAKGLAKACKRMIDNCPPNLDKDNYSAPLYNVIASAIGGSSATAQLLSFPPKSDS